MNIPYRVSEGPLHLLIDGTGIKVVGEGEWNARKHGGPKRRVWRKIHIGIDKKTLEIRAAEFTTSNVGDAPMLPELLGQVPPDQEIATVTGDGAFDTRKCHDAIAARGAAAIIPPRKNAKPWKPDTPGAVARNEILRTSQRFGRAIWRRWSGYHRRSRVETKMHCVKLLGQRLTARDFDRQVAEFQVRVAVLNGFTALGIPVTEAIGQVRPTKGEGRPSPDLCNRADPIHQMPGLNSYALSIKHCRRIEEAFVWAKTVGGMAQTVYRGIERVRSRFILTMATNNLARLPRLLAA